MIFQDIFNFVIYEPLYNGLVFFTTIAPEHSLGISIITLTILVRFILFPLSHKSIKTQATLRNIDPEIKKVKEQYKENKQQQAQEVMKLYKKHGVNPFSGCLFVFVQIPIIFGLYYVFWKGLAGGVIDESLLYSFVHFTNDINFSFLTIFDLKEKNIFLAAIAGISQFIQMRLALPPTNKNETVTDNSFSEQFKKNMAFQARFVLPAVVFFVAIGFPSAIALYWITSNVFSIAHELIVRKRATLLLKKNPPQS